MQYTVYFAQVNRTNFQVEARNEEEAVKKAGRLFKKYWYNPPVCVEEGWMMELDGEDK